jgi:hypothetical protein
MRAIKHNIYLLSIIFSAMWCAGGCSDDSGLEPPPVNINYPSFIGVLEVENRSQFPYTELYLHQGATLAEDPGEDSEEDSEVTKENLLTTPLNPNEVISVEVVASQYITAIRPRVSGGPLWRVRSDRPVTFYVSDEVPQPRLWILDQGFIVIDALSSAQEP